MLLNDAGERAGPKQRIVTLLCKPPTRARIEFDCDVAVGKLLFELEHEFVDDPSDRLRRQRSERDRRVESIAELGSKHAVDRFVIVTLTDTAAQTNPTLFKVGRPFG